MPYNRHTNLQGSYSQAVEERDENGARGPSIINIPAGTKLYKLDLANAGKDHYFNILPYNIETENHPSVFKGKRKIGDGDFRLDIYTHRVDGVLKGNVLCMSQTYGKPCPYEQEVGDQDTKSASHRTVFWVQECDRRGNPIGDGKPQLFITSHYAFTKTFLEEVDIQGKQLGFNGPVPFADPDKGYVIGFRFRAATAGGGIKYAELSRVDFLERANPIPQATLDSIPALDTLLVIPTAKMVHDALYGKTEDAAPAEEAEPLHESNGTANGAANTATPPANQVRPDESF